MPFFSKKQKPPGEEIEIGDFKPGDIDSTTGKKIRYIAYQTKKFIVTIDIDTNLNWLADENMSYACDFGETVSQVGLIEALVDRIFQDSKNRIAYKKILADALARLLDECDSKTANQILEEAKIRVLAHSKERVRMAYINYAVLSVVFVGVLVIVALLNRASLLEAVGSQEIFRIIVCTLLGGIGAFITTFFRFQNYKGSVISGLPIHRLDGFLRVFYGLIAGIIISLAIKGKVLAAFADNQQPWILYFFAMIAGASEILIPNLIQQTESQANLKKTDPAIPGPVTPDPVTPSPAVPDPVTSDPIATDPAIPDPVIPDPVTPNPAVPDPLAVTSEIPEVIHQAHTN